MVLTRRVWTKIRKDIDLLPDKWLKDDLCLDARYGEKLAFDHPMSSTSVRYDITSEPHSSGFGALRSIAL